ncbi:MAG TPA: tetratricopeptide repeat protein [Pyrinomonadaceae bacterium]|nr:tetratricopeptide repeat protein [Pyrinomonadaceae bacterium]
MSFVAERVSRKANVSLSFMVSVLLALAGAVLAQNPDASQPGKTSEPSKPRSRRVATEESATIANSSREQGDALILKLREQIDQAPTPQERTQLQFKLVDQLLSSGMKQEAVSQLQSMRSEDRFEPQAFYNVGNALARLGDSEGAIAAYRKAIEQRKGRYSRALNNMGVVLLRVGRWDESAEALLSALRLENFRYAEASYNLGRLYAARGEADMAVREWRRALVVDPEHSAAAQALSLAGSEAPIKVAAVGSSGSTSAAKATSLTAPVARSSKPVARETRAAKTSTKVSHSSISSPVLTVDTETFNYLQRARNARERNRNLEAVENYERVISRMGGYFAPANLELSYALIALERREDALANLLKVAVKDGPQYPISYYHLGRLYELKGELKLAEENYNRAAQLYGHNNAQFLLDLSRIREKRGDIPGALASMEEYVAVMEKQNHKPEWSDARLTSLRQKLAASPTRPNQ